MDGLEEIARHVLEHGRPVKDEEWDGEWRDYDWDHAGAGCSGWQRTAQSETVLVPLGGGGGGMLFTVTHCRCACRVHPHVIVGLEGTLG